MDRKVAKELLHIQSWFERVDEIIHRGSVPISTTTFCRRPATR